jgi:hypothetical protein
MTTIVHARPERQITTTRRTSPLLPVLIWELRRFRASRLFWFQALGCFCFLLFVAGTSARGLLHTLPLVLVVLVLLLPFVTADGVTRDLSRRTHELLMTTALPTWAYVWGRYLAGLLISLGLALLLLASILGMGGLLHLTVADYPLPQIGAGDDPRQQLRLRLEHVAPAPRHIGQGGDPGGVDRGSTGDPPRAGQHDHSS